MFSLCYIFIFFYEVEMTSYEIEIWRHEVETVRWKTSTCNVHCEAFAKANLELYGTPSQHLRQLTYLLTANHDGDVQCQVERQIKMVTNHSKMPIWLLANICNTVNLNASRAILYVKNRSFQGFSSRRKNVLNALRYNKK